jgi:peptidoglycan lytic transglycosylase
MSSRTLVKRLRVCAATLPAVLALAAPLSAGAAATPSVTSTTGGAAPTAPVLPTPALDPPVLVVGGPITVRTRPATFLGDVLNFHGTTRPSAPGATVLIQTPVPGSASWTTLAQAKVDRHGAFLAQWRTNVTGHIAVRAIIATASAASTAHGAADEVSQTGELAVYTPAVATYFGPGFYGQQTACGETMTPELVGVANRTLPCGTKVEVNYAGKTLIVPVVDRGPYANGADWDLTAATAAALGMTETETIGTILTAGAASPAPAPAPTSPLNTLYEHTTGGVVPAG